ncbi:MAG: efflux RND transporter periplasmic adaptor subunit [Gemmatimonadota bacterium]
MTRRLPGCAALLALPVLLAACTGGTADEETPTLETSTVERRTIQSSVEATGTVEPVRRMEVKSQAAGEILEMPVELGDRVERGDLLVRIDPRDEVNELQQAEADLQRAEAQLEVAESRLERSRALRDSGVVAADELETAVLEHANARSEHRRARTRLELAREQREDATVRAPIDGTVITRDVEGGQIITSTNDVTGGTTLLTMADLGAVQVRTLVDESDVGRIESGLPVEITVEAYRDQSFRGEVEKIEPQATVEQNVTMFPVLSRIENEDRVLRPGMNADVEIVVGRKEDVLALPNSGIKMPDEARRLVEALELDPSLLEQDHPEPPDRDDGPDDDGERADDADDADEPPDDGLPTAGEIRSMSPDERKELFESLSEGERRRLMQRMRQAAQEAQGRPGGDDSPTEAFVFVRDDEGRLTLRPVLVGLSNFEHTEVAAGLEEGDTVVNVPLALVQQQELLRRVRERSGVPGMGG